VKSKLKASIDDESGVFSISFTDIDPVFAQAVTNYCVSYMEKRFDEMGIDKNKLRKENLEVNISNTYQEILQLEKDSRALEFSVSEGAMANSVKPIIYEASRIKLELTAKENVYTQLKAQYELLKVSMSSESPVFQVLEYAEIPDSKSGPHRATLCIIVTFVAFLVSSLFVFLLHCFENLKIDPEILSKRNKGPKT
jgi:uncharacterized protein involved in exopolysaccharide biosynthesis